LRLLLDTAVFLFVIQAPERLSNRAAAVLSDLSNSLELSSVSITELAIKTASRKLQLELAELRGEIEDLSIRVLPYGAVHAFKLFDLARHHCDPFDRQIIAAALAEEIPIVTPDRAFHLYKGLKVIW
jgi:PIN domain nuclease of toxin-antitoxin system